MGVNKVDYFGETVVDMTDATVTPYTLLSGAKAYDAAGNLIEGAVVIAPIDSTLSVEGAAADAKATGDAISGAVKKSGDTIEGELFLSNRVVIANNYSFASMNSDGETEMSMVLLGPSNSSLYGYGSYTKEIGTAFYEGNKVCIQSKTDITAIGDSFKFNGTDLSVKGHTHQRLDNPDGVGFLTIVKDGAYFVRAGDNSKTYNLGGTNYRWSTVYSKNALNTSSDMRLKKNFSTDYSKYIDMLDRIQPTTFIRTNTEDGKRHTGYKAQAVLKAMKDAGLAEKDFAGFERHMQEEGSVYTYGLAYEEFIPILHAKINQLEERIKKLEEKEK